MRGNVIATRFQPLHPLVADGTDAGLHGFCLIGKYTNNSRTIPNDMATTQIAWALFIQRSFKLP